MSDPFSKWYCDTCGGVIEEVQHAYVIWKSDDLGDRSFKIIHQGKCDQKGHEASNPLTDFLGERGLAYLLAFLTDGPLRRLRGHDLFCRIKDLDEFVDF